MLLFNGSRRGRSLDDSLEWLIPRSFSGISLLNLSFINSITTKKNGNSLHCQKLMPRLNDFPDSPNGFPLLDFFPAFGDKPTTHQTLKRPETSDSACFFSKELPTRILGTTKYTVISDH